MWFAGSDSQRLTNRHCRVVSLEFPERKRHKLPPYHTESAYVFVVENRLFGYLKEGLKRGFAGPEKVGE